MLNIGSLVKSLKGHDKDRTYLVVEIKKEFALLVDGQYRKLDNPKIKRIKHLVDLHEMFKDFQPKYSQKKLYDFEIKTFIKNIMHKV